MEGSGELSGEGVWELEKAVEFGPTELETKGVLRYEAR